MTTITKLFGCSLILCTCFLQSFSKTINVKKMGAKGDGKTDDTKAIQACINACSPLSTNVIYFPKGVYVIGSYTVTKNYFENYCLRIHSSLWFKGEGKQTTIRFANHLFDKVDTNSNAHLFYGNNITDIKFSNFSVDLNGSNNLVPENIIKNHCAIFIDGGNNAVIQNLSIKNCAGRNMLIIKGVGKKILIEKNNFYNGGNYVGTAKANKYQTDFSFVYCEWDSAIIADNRLVQQNTDIALNNYTGGIEIHGSYCIAERNIIVGCFPAFFLSSSWHSMEATKVENNKMINCLKGISFWVYNPINNVSILNNEISLTHTRRLKLNVLVGIEVPNGNSAIYSFSQANNAPLSNLTISGNKITSTLPENAFDKTAGMMLHSFQKSTIEKNHIEGMNYGGIVLQGSKWGTDSLSISNNVFKDFKQNNDSKAVGGYIIATDTYSPLVKKPLGFKNIILNNNSFLRTVSKRKTIKNSGSFLGAFIALPNNMNKEFQFKNNSFSDVNEKMVLIKTD